MKCFSATYRFLAIVLSLLVLTSSVAISVDVHFCKEKLSDISFSARSQTDSCKKTTTSVKKCCQKGDSHTEITLTKHSDCCATNTIVTQSSANTLSNTSAEVQKIEISSSAIVEKIFLLADNEVITTQKEVSFLNYSPLLLTKDIVILAEQLLC